MSITYSEFVFVALGIYHADETRKAMHYNVTMRYVRVTIVLIKSNELHILSV